MAQQPDLVLFDADQRVVGVVNHPKSRAELLFQSKNAESYMARAEALAGSPDDTDALKDPAFVQTLIKALDDPFWRIRQLAAGRLANYGGPSLSTIEPLIRLRATRDPKSAVRAEALGTLATFRNPSSSPIFKAALADSSYAVVAVGLENYLKGKPADASAVVERFAKTTANGSILAAIGDYYSETADPRQYDWFISTLKNLKSSERYGFLLAFGKYLLLSKEALQKQAVPTLEAIARTDSNPYARFGAYQALGLLLDLPGIAKLRADIRAAEKDEQLRAVYKQMGE